jgi:hypothetical protein
MKTNKCYFCQELHHKKDTLHCSLCHATACHKHVYQWVDENNVSISKYQPLLCLFCYNEKYPKDKPELQFKLLNQFYDINPDN